MIFGRLKDTVRRSGVNISCGEVEAAQIIPDALVGIAQGGDVTEITTSLDEQIEAILND